MAYRFQGQGEAQKALVIFEVVTALFPKSANAWNSLGEARMASGDHEKARSAFQRSLECAPGDPTLDEPMRRKLIEDATKVLQSSKVRSQSSGG